MQSDSSTNKPRRKAAPSCSGQQAIQFAEQQKSIEAPRVFNHPMFGDLRVIEQGGEPWFVAKDACGGLEIKNSRDALGRLEDDEKGVVSTDTPGGKQALQIVSFPGLLSLILGSRKPEAREYKRWVTHEVLPSVHKHGGYIAGQERMEPEELLSRALLYCNSKVESLERVVALKSEQIHEQNKRIDSMAPKAALAEAVIVTKDEINVADLSAILQQVPGSTWKGGRNTLHKRLMADGFTRRNRNGDIVPSQKSVKLGVLRVKESHRPASDGGVHTDLTTMVTGKGQSYFVKRYAGEVA